MINIKSFIATTFLAGALVAQAQPVNAQYGQYGQNGQYGQTPTSGQNIIIDKLVAEPGTATTKGGVEAGVYRDNLLVNGKRYAPGDQVVFKIVVKNTTNQTLKNIQVTDRVPAFVEPMVGPGNFNAANRTVTYTIRELAPGKEDIQYIRMQIYPQAKLPVNQGIVKEVNVAEVTVNGQRDDDSSQYFIEKQVVGINSVPNTGPELGLAFLALQGIGLAVGLKLRQHES